MLTKEKVQEILEEVFSDYVRVEDADVQKVYDGLMDMLSEQAVEQLRALDTLCCEEEGCKEPAVMFYCEILSHALNFLFIHF